MIKYLKEKLYFLKGWYNVVFLYPQEKLIIKNSLDYNEYWIEKLKNRTLGLSRYEKERAKISLSIIGGAGGTVSDIACGPGAILEYLQKKNLKIKGTCYDISTFALDLAKEKGLQTHLFDINKREDLESVNSADYFLLLEILEHIPHGEVVLDYLFRKANKGVIFSFPNTGYFLWRIRLLLGRTPSQWRNFPNEHLRFFTKKDLLWWLKALGYSNYEIIYYQGLPGLRKILPGLFAGSFVVYLKK